MGQAITAEEKRTFQKKWLLKCDYGQGFLCRLCGKETWGGPDCQHLKSAQHVEKETEEILMDRLFGTSAGRRLGEGCHIPTKAAVRAYWGENVENLITILEAKMRAGEEIRFKYGKSAKSASHVICSKIGYRFHLAIIKYNETTGSYHNNTYSRDDVRLWNLLPEVEDEEMERIYRKNQKKGDKWWPVIMCQERLRRYKCDPSCIAMQWVVAVVSLYSDIREPNAEAFLARSSCFNGLTMAKLGTRVSLEFLDKCIIKSCFLANILNC